MNGPVFESLLDATIAKLVTFGSSKGEVSPVTVRSHSFRNVLSKVDARPTISAKEVQTILKKMKEIFLSQPMLLELAAPGHDIALSESLVIGHDGAGDDKYRYTYDGMINGIKGRR